MSLVFNDTSTELGICQEVDSICGTDSTSYSLKKKARRINMALSDFIAVALGSDDRWQFDDSNYTTFPIGQTQLNSGQADYGFGVDMLKVLKVQMLDQNGSTVSLIPLDITDTKTPLSTLFNTSGTPTHYDKNGGSIVLYPTPNYTVALGLTVYYQRDASAFASTDTSKTPGIPSIFHGYLALKVALPYLRDAAKDNYVSVRNEVQTFEKDGGSIEEFFSKRNKDERPAISGRVIDCK